MPAAAAAAAAVVGVGGGGVVVGGGGVVLVRVGQVLGTKATPRLSRVAGVPLGCEKAARLAAVAFAFHAGCWCHFRLRCRYCCCCCHRWVVRFDLGLSKTFLDTCHVDERRV